MKFISHRGNISGKNISFENKPQYIEKCIQLGYECEIDLRVINDKLFLGHDNCDYEITLNFLLENKKNLWVHCKNIESVIWLKKLNLGIHFFWHETDEITLTSKNIIWAFPGKQPILNSIAVLPEISNEQNLSHCLGICSDNINFYKTKYGNI
ncbi:hypothetical protein N8340_02175 [Flavobacteriaceae bacterium]|nr:hypothetical protein [Flavobacteriaceae bacterium]